MKCKQCYSEVANGVSTCPICGAAIVDTRAVLERAQAERLAKHPPKSKIVAFFIAWITCGLFTWKYLGDDAKFKERISEFLSKLMGALIIVGIFSYIWAILKWWVGDMYGIVTGRLRYSDGTGVW